MKLSVIFKGHTVEVLVDSGSTHSFINNKLCSQLELPFEEQQGVKVVVANGESICSKGKCKKVLLNVNFQKFWVDLYELSLSGFDLVLGVNWLKQWSYKEYRIIQVPKL